jgi:septal ring factor EnvC (AmiA/AmiB activator)
MTDADVTWPVARLQQLRAEYAEGENRLLEIERHREQIRAQLLRIEGAIRVLEEQIASNLVPDRATDAV